MRPQQQVRRPAGTRQKPAETAKVILLYRPETRRLPSGLRTRLIRLIWQERLRAASPASPSRS